jgi:hypothetical protein
MRHQRLSRNPAANGKRQSDMITFGRFLPVLSGGQAIEVQRGRCLWNLGPRVRTHDQNSLL